jgi:hypothetical protein
VIAGGASYNKKLARPPTRFGVLILFDWVLFACHSICSLYFRLKELSNQCIIETYFFKKINPLSLRPSTAKIENLSFGLSAIYIVYCYQRPLSLFLMQLFHQP